MATKLTPNIIKDGLILHFDSAAERSYVSGASTWNNLADVNDYDGTQVGTPVYSGQNGGYFQLDATQQWNLGDVLFNTSSYTKIAIFSPNGERNHNFLSGGFGAGDARHAFWIDGPDTDILRAGHAGDYSRVSASVGEMQGKWNWGGVSFDSTEGWKMYYNGELVASSSDTTAIDQYPGAMYIATFASASPTNRLSGSLASVMLYNRVLTDEEMLQNYNAVKTRFIDAPVYITSSAPDPILQGLRVAYQFEDTDSTFSDATGSLDGTSFDTVSTGSFSGAGNSLYYTIADNSYSSVLSGSHAGEFEMTASNALTMMVDLYPTANGGSATSNVAGLFISVAGNHVYNIGYNSANQIRGRVYDTINRDVITTATVPLNTWGRVMMRYESGSVIQVHISGSAEESGSVAVGEIATDTAGLGFHISMPPNFTGYLNRQFEGRVDNVMIWERKLTDVERDQMFDGNPTYNDLI